MLHRCGISAVGHDSHDGELPADICVTTAAVTPACFPYFPLPAVAEGARPPPVSKVSILVLSGEVADCSRWLLAVGGTFFG